MIALSSVGGRLWSITGHDNNLPIFHVYILLEGVLLCIVFRHLLAARGDTLPWFITAGSFAFLWLLNVLFGEGITGYPAYIHALEALLVIVLVVLWFAKILREKIVQKPLRTFGFWLCTGLLIYFSGNLLLFVFSTFVVEQSARVFDVIWGVHGILVILLYLIYTFAILWARKTPKSS